MKYIYILILTQVFLSMSACQSDETKNQTNARSLFINYEVRYLEDEKELRGLAYFKQGDSIRTAVSKDFSNVTFQSSAMKKQNLGARGSRYILNRKGSYSSNLDFSYNNNEGIPINYDLSMPAVDAFSIKEGKIQKSKGATIVWNGKALDASQSLVLMFTDKDNQSSSISIKGPSQVSKVFIPSSDLSRLTLGEGQLYMVKKQVLKTQEQNQRVFSIVEYYTSAIDINVVD